MPHGYGDVACVCRVTCEQLGVGGTARHRRLRQLVDAAELNSSFFLVPGLSDKQVRSIYERGVDRMPVFAACRTKDVASHAATAGPPTPPPPPPGGRI